MEADSFLYKMVRKIVGTLIEFSVTNRNPDDIIKIIKSGIIKIQEKWYLQTAYF